MELVWLLNENSVVPFRTCFLRLGIMWSFVYIEFLTHW